MKKIMTLLLVYALVASCCCGALAEEDEVWLPDPNTALGAEGAYFKTNTEDNGVTYDFYTYDLEMTYDECSHFIVVYTEAVKTLGYTAKRLSLENAIWYETYSKSGFTAEIGVFVSAGAKEISEGGKGGWRIVLAVPQGMVFCLGNGAPDVLDGNTICFACRGSRKCTGCLGQGQVNYGSGKETCILCNGEGYCMVCEGEGSY